MQYIYTKRKKKWNLQSNIWNSKETNESSSPTRQSDPSHIYLQARSPSADRRERLKDPSVHAHHKAPRGSVVVVVSDDGGGGGGATQAAGRQAHESEVEVALILSRQGGD